jgi:ribonucleoside-diphosphate reductase alpha chain
VAYLAAVVLERFRVLGIVSKDLEPVHTSAVASETQAEGADPRVGTGMVCPSCHTKSLHKQDGGKVCAHCGYTGECG